MKTQPLKAITFLLFFVLSVQLYAQTGIITGTLTSETDGLPLPGVNVIVEGTSNGVQTDFDGNYTITCKVGDVLIFSFLGMQEKRIVVTPQMFGETSSDYLVQQIPVDIIETDSYKKALETNSKPEFLIPTLSNSKHTYNYQNSYSFDRIKNIKTNDSTVNLAYFIPDIFYEINVKSNFGVQYFQNRNLPRFQSRYVQGASSNGSLSFLGAETGNFFSFGPNINALEFDGNNYDYDPNGQLVPAGTGNAMAANIYDNSILKTSIKSSKSVSFSVSTSKQMIELNYSNNTFKDVFNKEKAITNEVSIAYKKNERNTGKLSWNTFFKYGSHIDKQPNINGFVNNVILNAWATPISFDNSQNPIISDGSQRSFSPNHFNNPNWLLENNKNKEHNRNIIASLQNSYKVSNDIRLKSNLSYAYSNDVQNFGLIEHTVGFENGYASEKTIKKNVFNAIFNFCYSDYYSDSDFKLTTTLDYSLEDLYYQLNEIEGFNSFSFNNSESQSSLSTQFNRNTLRIQNKFVYEFDYSGIEITAANNMYISSIQGNKWILPYVNIDINFNRLLDIDFCSDFHFKASAYNDIKEPSLFYSGQGHNSLPYLPSESLSYTANNDLFVNSSIALEEKTHYELATSFRVYLMDFRFKVGANYFNSKTKGNVFPVFDNNQFQLANIADTKSHGFEMSFDADIDISGSFKYHPKIVFSSNRIKVDKLYSQNERLPVNGFSNVSNNLIEGESVGVIVGSAYARDHSNHIIIGNDGFPLIDSEPQIIGDPVPDFNLGISNRFTWERLSLNIVVDIQKGGEVWNGTQNTLNYLGVSEESAINRTVTNFIYEGINQQGLENTIPVDFYNPENDISANRYVRYGFTGVDEDAIEDASYINLKSIEFTYTFNFDKKEDALIRQLDIGVYALNLITWTKFNGASPYRSLYDNGSGSGLNFFNTPITSEIGFKLNIKI